ncbi:conserved hypothetical protein [Culex quinquefasciatus]|uniref:Uncharacterized protein n=1 Tax=Culex quinquefasciatus TaxID=7176 RepID=B0X6M6_CULQU|nr:conserved hypothetical protein [Culex quinquefasciatus]|eukprot:XP_001865298.1 conserved hypothetical protein [Culex quinquefasciatus]
MVAACEEVNQLCSNICLVKERDLLVVIPATLSSQCIPELPQDKIAALTEHIQEADAGSATFSMAYARPVLPSPWTPKVNAYEKELLKKAILELKKTIQKDEELSRRTM